MFMHGLYFICNIKIRPYSMCERTGSHKSVHKYKNSHFLYDTSESALVSPLCNVFIFYILLASIYIQTASNPLYNGVNCKENGHADAACN